MPDTPRQSSEVRRYRILDLIGKGGFGRVYRARLEGPQGFVKDVALKLLHADGNTPPEVVQRFRDEARILGLVRDRAIVSVDPPTMLAGRWAVVMEFVDGASAARLIRLGPVPAGVVMEVGMEVARALHKIYKHPGIDGQPLRLIHRDIKPGNLQITPSGEIKLLDFGIARADFQSRESHTTFAIGGTRGYIAPERLKGFEGPEGDIYSLGALITRLASGRLPDENEVGWIEGMPEPGLEGDPLETLLAYAVKMRAVRPADRPSAKEVQRDLATMRRLAEGEPLRDWAERVVPAASRLAEDDLVGTVVAETLSGIHVGADESIEGPTSLTRDDIRAGVGAYLMGIALVVLGVVTGIAVLYSMIRTPPEAGTVAERAPVVLDAPVMGPPEEPTELQPSPQIVPELRPRATTPSPVAVALLPLKISSIPFGATVFVDGVEMGTTPQLKLTVTPGSHEIRLVSGEATIERSVQVGKRLANRFVWRIDGAIWEEGF